MVKDFIFRVESEIKSVRRRWKRQTAAVDFSKWFWEPLSEPLEGIFQKRPNNIIDY